MRYSDLNNIAITGAKIVLLLMSGIVLALIKKKLFIETLMR